MLILFFSSLIILSSEYARDLLQDSFMLGAIIMADHFYIVCISIMIIATLCQYFQILLQYNNNEEYEKNEISYNYLNNKNSYSSNKIKFNSKSLLFSLICSMMLMEQCDAVGMSNVIQVVENPSFEIIEKEKT